MLTRRHFFRHAACTIVAASLICSPLTKAEAWLKHGSPTASGRSVLNLDDILTSYAFCNILKQSYTSIVIPSTMAATDFSDLGFPLATPAANVGFQTNAAVTGSWVLKMRPSHGTGGFYVANSMTVTAVGGTVNGVTYGNGGQSTGAKPGGVTITGSSQWRVVFTLDTAGALTIGMPAFGTYASMSGVILCRLSDEDAVDADPNALTPEWITKVLGTGCSDLRFMNWILHGNDDTMVSQFGYRPSINAFTFFANRFPPAAWVGNIAGTNTFTCGDTNTPSLSAWTDGLTWQGRFTGSSSSTTQTIAPNSLTAKTLVTTQGLAPPSNYAVAGQIATFTYSAAMDKVAYRTDAFSDVGMWYGPPVEVLVSICNTLRKNLYYNLHIMTIPATAASLATTIATTLITTLTCTMGYNNEIWNNSFQQYSFANESGRALGFDPGSSRDNYGWTGLQSRRLLGAATTAWSAVRSLSSFKRIMESQAFGPPTSYSTYMWKGDDLASVANGGAGNSQFVAYTGNANYRTVGNRPVDYCEHFSYATYYYGAQSPQFDVQYSILGTAELADLKTQTDNYASGNPTLMATALAWLDNDIRQGQTASSHTNGSETLKALDQLATGVGIYPEWQAQVTSDGFTQTFKCYEGGLAIIPPTTSTANSVFGSTTYGGAGGLIDNFFEAYKTNTLARTLAKNQFQQFMGQFAASPNFGLLPSSAYPCWFIFSGGNEWALIQGNIITGTPYQTYNGINDFNTA